MRLFLLIPLLMACASDDSDGQETGSSTGCGDPVSHDVSVLFAVVDGQGNGVANLEVALVDRSWEPGTLGSGTTDGQGEGALLAQSVTDLPNCWGTVLNYVVEVNDPTSYYAPAEKAVNSYLYGAIDDGSFEADLTDFPIAVVPQ